jgi:gluconate 2-dehydrogenase gamma chain
MALYSDRPIWKLLSAPPLGSIGSLALTCAGPRLKFFASSLQGENLINEFDRRRFLTRSFAALGASWASTHWTAVVSAAEHAHKAAAARFPEKFEYFTPAEAQEVEALASCIIPSNGTPGAREAGVVYFIDRALVTFAADDQKTYRSGLPEMQKRVAELYPGVKSFSAASAEQQQAVMESLDEAGSQTASRRPFRASAASQSLFETLRAHTIVGFLIDPESDRRGNRGGVGWAVIGRDPAHSFQAPFSEIDKNYPGWQPDKDSDKQ